MKHNWTLDELIDHWTLLPNELALANQSRATHNRLGFALLLKYFQIEGRFPRHRRDVPIIAIDYVARQLKLAPDTYSTYAWQGRVIARHRVTIRSFLGFRETTVADGKEIAAWLQENILPHTQHLEALLTTVYDRYRSLKIEPPTRGRVERQARSALHQYTEQFCETITSKLSAETQALWGRHNLTNNVVKKVIEFSFKVPRAQLRLPKGASFRGAKTRRKGVISTSEENRGMNEKKARTNSQKEL